MRFCDLFISYKIGLKSIENTIIPFTQLPLHRKFAVIAAFVITIISVFLCIFKLYIFGSIVFGIGIIFLVVFRIIDSKKTNLELMFKEHYSPYSKKRMDMLIDVLKEYDINLQNINTLDLLIDEAQKAQIQSDFLLPLKKPLKIFGAAIFPIITYTAKKNGDTASQNEIIIMAVQIIIFALLILSLFISLGPIVKYILYRDYHKYDELIYDLRQIKLFYTQENSLSSN